MKTPRYFQVKKWILIVVIALLTIFTGLIVIGYCLTFFGVINQKDKTHPEGMGADEQRESHKQVSFLSPFFASKIQIKQIFYFRKFVIYLVLLRRFFFLLPIYLV